MLKGMKDLMGLVQNVGKMQADMARIQEELRGKQVEGSAGGGMVTVRVNGRQEMIACTIDAEAVGDDVEMLEDLIVAAVNQAMDNARKLAADEMAKLTGSLDPELQKKLGQQLQDMI